MPDRKCEAPIHVKDCSGIGETRDHFTPRSIANLLGWSETEIGSEENIQYLSRACHREKDKTTPQRLQLLKRQLRKGKNVLFGQHQKIFKG